MKLVLKNVVIVVVLYVHLLLIFRNVLVHCFSVVLQVVFADQIMEFLMLFVLAVLREEAVAVEHRPVVAVGHRPAAVVGHRPAQVDKPDVVVESFVQRGLSDLVLILVFPQDA